jgi:hypothetical protein
VEITCSIINLFANGVQKTLHSSQREPLNYSMINPVIIRYVQKLGVSQTQLDDKPVRNASGVYITFE